MKKITSIAALLLVAFTAGAQDWSGKIYRFGEIYPGYYVGEKGDTVRGYFKMGDQITNQVGCNYYKNETDKKATEVFDPEDIQSYKVGDKIYRSIHYSGGLLAKPIKFNLVIKDGAITQFKWYDIKTLLPVTTYEEKEVYVNYHDKANPKTLAHDDTIIGFAKKFSAFIGDYKELSEKVANKEKKYTAFQLYDIIDEYNAWAKTH